MDVDFNKALHHVIREALEHNGQGLSASMPELITIAQAAELCGCDASVIRRLFRDRESTGFPGIDLGPRTKRIDKGRLIEWLIAGGLTNGEHHKERRTQVSHPRLKAVGRRPSIR